MYPTLVVRPLKNNFLSVSSLRSFIIFDVPFYGIGLKPTSMSFYLPYFLIIFLFKRQIEKKALKIKTPEDTVFTVAIRQEHKAKFY